MSMSEVDGRGSQLKELVDGRGSQLKELVDGRGWQLDFPPTNQTLETGDPTLR